MNIFYYESKLTFFFNYESKFKINFFGGAGAGGEGEG